MTLQLTGRSEPKGSFKEFYGRPTKKMPSLIKAGCVPISVAGVINRRDHAPADVIDEWKNHYFFTGDGVIYDGRKNAKVVLDLALLREINPNTRLDNYAAVLSDHLWDGLGGDNVLYLSADKIEKAHKKGFVKKYGLWQPENSEVGKVWDFLTQGKDLKEYAQKVSEKSRYNNVMKLFFDKSRPSTPNLRSLVVGRIDNLSLVSGDLGLNGNFGRLAGVAPEAHSTRENSSIKQPTAKEIADVVYQHLGNVDITKGVTKKGLLQALRSKGL